MTLLPTSSSTFYLTSREQSPGSRKSLWQLLLWRVTLAAPAPPPSCATRFGSSYVRPFTFLYSDATHLSSACDTTSRVDSSSTKRRPSALSRTAPTPRSFSGASHLVPAEGSRGSTKPVG
eukprot:364794-Chlamydomonas_euryale.AAC.9